jgi:putative ABC transport system permease protein
VIETIRRTPEVADLAEQIVTTVLVRGEEVPLIGYTYGVYLRRGRDLTPGKRAVIEGILRGEVAVSRVFMEHFGLGAGDSIELPTARGVRAFRIAGERQGMANSTGIIFMDLETFDSHWPRVGAEAVTIFPSGDPESLVEAVRGATFSQQSLFFTRNAELVERAERFALRFDGLLLAVATLTLVLGGVAIANLLLAIVAARRRELVLLRTAGAAPNQLAVVVLLDAALIASFSAALGLALGAVIAQPFIEILGREFGVYVDTHADPARLAILVALVAGSVLLSSVYPALLARRATTLEVTSFG